jgi:hypothetical protein
VLDLRTICNEQVGPFSRECQIFHVVGSLVRHVFAPSDDLDFQRNEAEQLARTLHAYLPLLKDEEFRYGFYCGALGVCCR